MNSEPVLQFEHYLSFMHNYILFYTNKQLILFNYDKPKETIPYQNENGDSVLMRWGKDLNSSVRAGTSTGLR